MERCGGRDTEPGAMQLREHSRRAHTHHGTVEETQESYHPVAASMMMERPKRMVDEFKNRRLELELRIGIGNWELGIGEMKRGIERKSREMRRWQGGGEGEG